MTLGWQQQQYFYEAWTKGRLFFDSFLFLVLGLNLESSGCQEALHHLAIPSSAFKGSFFVLFSFCVCLFFLSTILKDFKHMWLRWLGSSILCLNFNINQFWVCLTCWNRNVCLKFVSSHFFEAGFLSQIPGWSWGNAFVPLALCYMFGLFCLVCVFTLVFFAIFSILLASCLITFPLIDFKTMHLQRDGEGKYGSARHGSALLRFCPHSVCPC